MLGLLVATLQQLLPCLVQRAQIVNSAIIITGKHQVDASLYAGISPQDTNMMFEYQIRIIYSNLF